MKPRLCFRLGGAMMGALLCLSSVTASGQSAAPRPSRPAPAQPAPAQPAERPSLADSLTGAAKVDYEAGRLLFQDGDFAGAVLKFQSAHELSGDPRLLWNIAACEKSRRRYARMLVTLERYRTEAGAAMSESERQTVDELVSTARLLVGRVEVQVNVPGASITLDDEAIGISPLPGPFYADQGARRLRVTKPGFREVTRTEQIAGGGDLSVRIDLKRELHQGTLVVEAGPHDIILIDGKRVGQGRWAGAVASGPHSVRVTAPDHLPYQADVIVEDERRRRVAVTLEPDARGGSSAMWWWIGGGVAAAAGLIVGGYVLLKPDDPAPTPGYVGTVQLSIGPRGARFGGPPAGGRWP